ncbi:hypothetical protein CEXT_513341, partial [Caerostris extrusa]
MENMLLKVKKLLERSLALARIPTGSEIAKILSAGLFWNIRRKSRPKERQ